MFRTSFFDVVVDGHGHAYFFNAASKLPDQDNGTPGVRASCHERRNATWNVELASRAWCTAIDDTLSP